MPSQRVKVARQAGLLQASIDAAREAAEFITTQAQDLSRLDWQLKQPADFVTEVDTGAESRIRDILTTRVKGATIVGEEFTPTARIDAEVAFVVDPLDGTTNFLHGYPVYAVSIGALLDGELVAGVVLDVSRRELFTATDGEGAKLNGAPIAVSTTSETGRALIGTGFPFKNPELLPEYTRQFVSITRETAGIRRAGSAALDLAQVACGRFDAFWELRLAPWDIAAGLLLIREAGGRVTDAEGVEIAPSHSPVAASNAVLHDWLLDHLRAPASS